MSSLQESIDQLRQSIAESAQKSGRKPEDVLLLGVSKKVSVDTIREAYDCGIKAFGESKIQELKSKAPQLPGAIHWHMIGHLQTNKARDAVALSSFIHSVDSLHLAESLEEWANQQGKTQKILIQVNVSGESTKYGIKPETLEATTLAINAMPHLEIHGLMTMAPYSDDPEKARPHFALLRELRDSLQKKTGFVLPELSMGMSGDFLPAIEEGSTIVRIGTRLFGERS